MQNKEKMQRVGERPEQSGEEPDKGEEYVSLQSSEEKPEQKRMEGSGRRREEKLKNRPGQESEDRLEQSSGQNLDDYSWKSSVYMSFGRCEKKQESDLGRTLLFFIIKKVYNVDLEVENNPIQREAGGKPYLANHPDIYFNISHSEGTVICAVGRLPLGIDLQIHRNRNIEKTAKRILSQEEWNCFEMSVHAVECFYEYWTKKESYLKYTGEGIRRELRELEYSDCRFYRIPFDSGYSCTLCIAGQWAGEIVAVETEVVI